MTMAVDQAALPLDAPVTRRASALRRWLSDPRVRKWVIALTVLAL